MKMNSKNIKKIGAGIAAAAMMAALSACGSSSAGNGPECDLFSITLPEDTVGTWVAETTDNSISVFDKEQHATEFGGFAFSVTAYREPSEYAGGMDFKVGEFTAKDGTLYDIVMEYPSDIQWDYEKYEDTPPSYDKLYGGAEEAVKTLKGKKGGTFVWGGGTKGADLYGSVVEKYKTALSEGWDANRLESENMSPEFYGMSQDDPKRAGYAYADVNNDGIDEMLVGEIADGDMKGVIYDVYTMVNREPASVLSGSARNRYYLLDSGFLINEYSNGAMESGWDVFDIEPNTTNIMNQVKFKYDGYEDEEQPWFVGYSDDDWEQVTEDDFNSRKETFENYNRLDFTPFS